LRRVLRGEICPLETGVCLELGPSEARASKRRANSGNKLRDTRAIVARVSSL